MDCRPIGIFDSGIGGLTVLKECLKLMPNENYIYYADTKHLPYGNKSKEQIIDYSSKIIEFLISQNVKAIVIACGTVSSLAYEHLKSKFNLPIFDIISPVISEISDSSIGIIATKGSISSHTWENRINKYHPDAKIYVQACPKLVPLAENGLNDSVFAKIAIKKYLHKLKYNSIQTLLLGCTHYPLFISIIQKELKNNVKIINLGNPLAINLQKYLYENSIQNSDTEKGTASFFCSGNINDFLKKKDIILGQ